MGIDCSISEQKKHQCEIGFQDRGFPQKFDLDYFEVFAPVARYEIIRLVIVIATNRNYPLIHLNVKSTFLNGLLQEEVYVLEPPRFMKLNKEWMMYKLHKALYGMKQAPRVSNMKIDSFYKHLGFKKYEMGYNVYVYHTYEGNGVLMCLYVDATLLTGSCIYEINKFKKVLMNALYMYDLGNMIYFLGM